jgi:hypothetical protein
VGAHPRFAQEQHHPVCAGRLSKGPAHLPLIEANKVRCEDGQFRIAQWFAAGELEQARGGLDPLPADAPDPDGRAALGEGGVGGPQP